jgi:hypothetical protein
VLEKGTNYENDYNQSQGQTAWNKSGQNEKAGAYSFHTES